jgi:uncharacterized protein with PhoU and TrkA domain
MDQHIIVCGDDALATAIVEELETVGASVRVIAITREDTAVQLHPRRDARLRAGDTVYLVGPYRELLATLRKGQPPGQELNDEEYRREGAEVSARSA